MSRVYKARDRVLSELVAIKVLRSELSWDPIFAARFLSEIKLARKVSHRNDEPLCLESHIEPDIAGTPRRSTTGFDDDHSGLPNRSRGHTRARPTRALASADNGIDARALRRRGANGPPSFAPGGYTRWISGQPRARHVAGGLGQVVLNGDTLLFTEQGFSAGAGPPGPERTGSRPFLWQDTAGLESGGSISPPIANPERSV